MYKGFHQLELRRCGGSQIVIGGTSKTLQERPPTVVSRRPVDTVQYIYAKWDDKFAKVKLEASTIGHVNLNGIETKKDDPSRTLVGMARPYESRRDHIHWADTPETKMFILSWYNRRPKDFKCFPARDWRTDSAQWEEISSAFRIEFLVWGDEAVKVSSSGEIKNSARRSKAHLAIGFDGAHPEMTIPLSEPAAAEVWQSFNATAEKRFQGEEGYHYLTLLGKARPGESLVTRGRVTVLTFSTMG
ncbi:MAG: hypothetical protein V3U53_09120 [bacterium]